MNRQMRKMVGRVSKAFVSVLSAFALAITGIYGLIPQMTLTVYADSDKTITGLCTGAIANPASGAGGWSYVYYGAYEGEAMVYRVLDTAATEFNANKTMLLDCNSTIVNKKFDDDSNVWADSEIKEWLNGNDFYGSTSAFTTQEKAAIAASSKSDFSNDGQGRGYLDPQNLTGEHVFLLDAKEATRESYGYASDADSNNTRHKLGTDSWWLRSPANDDGYTAGEVGVNGYVIGDDVRSSHGVSPAFNINLESVIFSSEVSGGYKLTVKDENMTIAKTDGSDVTRAGNVVTVPYTISGTNAANATQVSVLLTNSEYSAGTAATSGYTYQKLNVTTWGTSGTGTFTLPAAYANKTCGTDYYAYILAEDVNEGNATDYASVPTAVAIPSAAKPALTITAKDKTFEYNDQIQGPGDITYENPDEIAGMVTVEGLQDGDTLTGITVEGQGKEVGEYDLIPSGATVNNESASDKYDVTYVKGKLTITSSSTYSVTVTNDGNGNATADPTSGTSGTTVSVTATPNSGYQFDHWEVVSGGVTLSDTGSQTATFTIGDSDVEVKAIFVKKDDSTPKHDDSDEGSSDSNPREEKTYDYLDELRAKLKTAIDLGGEQTVTWDMGTALPYDIMKTLQDNPKITLIFSYTYQGLDYKVTLSGQNVKAYATIPWYGPLYLYGNYGTLKPATTENITTGNRTYTVISGDTLSEIAKKLKTTVRSLVSMNNIKDLDRISIGQVLKY